jgi:CheY-like chemotaxis protein
LETARILRVGGNANENEVLETLLRGAGLPGVAFTDVAESLKAIAAGSVDLLLLDLMQPSNEVFAVLRAAAPGGGKSNRVPVVVTAPATANDRIQACC